MTRTTKGLSIIAMIILASAISGTGAQAVPQTFTALSCAYADVAASVALASDGDTVIIPTCTNTTPGDTNTWTLQLNITVGITLMGQGAGQTVLIDNVPKGGAACAGAASLIHINVTSNVPLRVTGFTIQGDAVDTNTCQAGHIYITGGSHAFRIDDITFTNQQTLGISTEGDLWGVIDHCSFNGDHKEGVRAHHTSWQGIGGFGDNSWAQPDTMGTQQAIFVEDDRFNYTNAVGASCAGSENGGRLVFRHNTCVFTGNHGTESTGRNRGARQYEIYNNTFNAAGQSLSEAFLTRGGTGVVFNNTITGSYNHSMTVTVYRDADAFAPWGSAGAAGACDGTGAYDNNVNGVYDSGTSTTALTDVLTDTTKNWTSNHWTGGYAVRNVTQGWGAVVTSNTATTITTFSSAYGQPRTWAIGDSYEIRLAYPCVDQVGQGPGVLLSGNPPTPTGWVKEALEPVYTWGNTLNGVSNPQTYQQYMHAQPNRDYYDATATFNGTSGVGSGLLSARPATCTPYVAYWATDTTTLYQCSATNTWTAHYTPFQYPHPLTGPAPPTTLTVTSVQ